MSHAEQGAERHRSWRVLLVGLGVGVAACALSLLMQTSSASAAEPSDSDSGVLGLVGSTLTTVASVTYGATDAVEAVLPAPVTAILVPAAPVVESVDTFVATTVASATDVVSQTAGSGILSGAVDLVSAVPVVGTITDDLGATDTLTGVTAPLDAFVADVVGGVTVDRTGILPSLGATPGVIELITGLAGTLLIAPVAALESLTTPPAVSAATTTLLAGGIATALIVALSTPISALAPPFRGSPSSGSSPGAIGGQGQASAVAALLRALVPAPRASGLSSRHSDDALPGAPVFDTDTSPD